MSLPLFAGFLRRAPRARNLLSKRVSDRIWGALAPALVAFTLAFIPPQQAHAEGKIKIAFVGDSSADGLWGGIIRIASRNSCLKDLFELGRYAKNGTGLTRADKFDWAKEVARLNERFEPHLFVVSIGLNDRQNIVEDPDRLVTAFDTPEWPGRYRDRIVAVIRNASARGAGVIWVGLTSMRDNVANLDADAKNNLFATAIDAAGVKGAEFIRPWRASNKDTEPFSTYVPDSKGVLVQVRAADGIHFTPVGDELVAAYLLPKIVANLADRNVAGALACQQQ
jgi:hypothetical protein